MKMHPRLARALYRSYLRASHHGQYPQVFGHHGAFVFSQQAANAKEHAPLALPSTPWQVRKRLQQCFRQQAGAADNTTSNPLDVLRHVHEQEAILLSTTTSTDGVMLPIFDYDQLAALPGERVQTLFLEPRYIDGLLPHLMRSKSTPQFLLRPSPLSTIATLVQLEWHQPVILPANSTGTTMGSVTTDEKDKDNSVTNEEENDMPLPLPTKTIPGVAVAFVAGSRVHIRHQEYQSPMRNNGNTTNKGQEEKASKEDDCWSTSTAPLAWAMEYTHLHDKDYIPPHKLLDYKATTKTTRTTTNGNNHGNHNHDWLLETRQYILHMLHCVLDYHGSDLAETLVHTKYGLPPLDPEAFSFWAMKFVLRPHDMAGRLEWLQNCQSTQQRLQFIVQQVEDISDAQLQAQQDDDNDDQQDAYYYETTRFG